MGQLFNRISRFVKSEIDDFKVSSHNYDVESDEELKRTIDELNRNNTTNEKPGDSTNDYRTRKDEKKVFTLDDAYLLLGLKPKDSIDEIKSAYKQKMKEYHPDRVANLGAELKLLAEQKTQQINNAYEIIKKYRGFN